MAKIGITNILRLYIMVEQLILQVHTGQSPDDTYWNIFIAYRYSYLSRGNKNFTHNCVP